jgi:hypothetical protein
MSIIREFQWFMDDFKRRLEQKTASLQRYANQPDAKESYINIQNEEIEGFYAIYHGIDGSSSHNAGKTNVGKIVEAALLDYAERYPDLGEMYFKVVIRPDKHGIATYIVTLAQQ